MSINFVLISFLVGASLGIFLTRVHDLYLAGHVNPDVREQFWRASDTMKKMLIVWDKYMRVIYPKRYALPNPLPNRLEQAYNLAFYMFDSGDSRFEIENALIDRFPDLFKFSSKEENNKQWHRIEQAIIRRNIA